MAHRLVGNWMLLSYDSVEPDGSTSKPFGEAVGRLMYDAAGNMAGQVMRPGRAAVTHGDAGTRRVRAAYTGYIAYFGTYEVNDAAGTVTHQVAGALNPEWVGGRQVRRLRFDGDRLVLEADITRPDGIRRHVLTWARVA
jgi:hypothetical protein